MHTNSKCNSNPPVKPVEGGEAIFFLFKPMNAPRQPVRGKKCKKVICVKMGKKEKGRCSGKVVFVLEGDVHVVVCAKGLIAIRTLS